MESKVKGKVNDEKETIPINDDPKEEKPTNSGSH
jgi:hypothetical protein